VEAAGVEGKGVAALVRLGSHDVDGVAASRAHSLQPNCTEDVATVARLLANAVLQARTNEAKQLALQILQLLATHSEQVG
jgi:hypothetical protein